MPKKPATLMNRMRALKTRHKRLEARIDDELARPMPDTLRLQTLKRMRLSTRDHIKMVTRQLTMGPPANGPQAA
ncbi:MAG: DUF465 domain-containing protein [Alphaproteobacteria bacterium]